VENITKASSRSGFKLLLLALYASEGWMKYLIILMFMVTSHVSASESLCGDVESDYRHPLTEDSFTKSNFEQALKSLKDIENDRAYDYVFYDIESDLMYIKGYMYKLHIKSNPGNPGLIGRFCEFMSKEAYLRHE